jgi:hypothetical protein
VPATSRFGGCLLLTLLLGWPAAAHAWTDTRVESVDVHMDVDATGGAQVLLQVGLRVRGGWLSRFEVAGLGPDLQLDRDKAPWLIGEDGRKYVPSARVVDGNAVHIAFERRRQAPWRGRYVLGMLYRVPLARAGAAGRPSTARWTLPPWRVDLRQVKVRIEGPTGLRVIDPGGGNVEVSRRNHGSRVALALIRPQLPRTVPWTVDLELPRATSTTHHTTAVQPWSTRLRPDGELLAGLLLALGCWIAHGLKRRRARAHGARAVPLIPMHHGLRAALIILTGVGAGVAHGASPDLALCLLLACVTLALTRRFERDVRARRCGQLRRVRQIDLARARTERMRLWWGAAAWLDATTAPGLCLLAALGSMLTTWPGAGGLESFGIQAGLAVLPLFFDTTRRSLPIPGGARLLSLQRVRRALPGDLPARLRLRVHAVAPTIAADAAEVDVCPERAAEGLARLRLTHGHGTWLGRPQTRLVWSAVVRPGSAAEQLLAAALPHARRRRDPEGRWVALEAVALEPGAELRVLLAWLAAERGAARPPLANAA